MTNHRPPITNLAGPNDLTEITVGPIVYEVRYVPNLHDDLHEPIDGAVYEGSALIEINAALDPQGRRVTLWHEVVELIAMQSGVKLPEGVYDALAYGIMGVLKQNPKIRRSP